MTMTHSRALAALTAVLLLCTPLGAAVATAGEVAGALGDLTIEELMNVEITSVSKKEEPLLQATSAIYVITGEDIRRSGATSIPEALRMAPGLQVARIDGNRWAISSRGFNAEFANKLLVLIDGRTVYMPARSGVYWDVQDTLLEDVDRIEVIRGPGATLWGANAVNGVINVITKRAADTQGLLVTAGGGTQEIGFGSVRYGGALGSQVQYRLYAKYFDRGAQAAALGIAAHDGWDVGQGGFRLDWAPATANSVTLQGDWYRGGEDETLQPRTQLTAPFQTPPVRTRTPLDGRNLLARWHYVLGERSDATVQAYYDHTERRASDIDERLDTVDIDAQHHVGLGVHDVVWGLGYRWVSDHFADTFTAGYHPDAETYETWSGFVQDQVPLVADRLRLTLGTKLEHNAFSGFEVQPNAMLLWTPHPRHAAWLSLARAVRTPSRLDRDLRIVPSTFPTADGPPAAVVLEGNRVFKSEKLVAYEMGYRVRPWDVVFADVAGFYQVYDDLSSTEPRAARFVADPAPHVELPLQYDNKAHGRTYGVETAVNWQAAPWWRLMLASTFLRMHIEGDPSSRATNVQAQEGDSPQHQLHLRSYVNLPHDVELDTALYYVDHLSNQGVPSHVRVDVRLGWHPTEAVELSLALQDLSDEHQLEFGRPDRVKSTEIERSVYGKITVRF
jgi:iron complex outermembrane receptor protein